MSAPIKITGSDDGGETRFLARPGANTVSLSDAAYIVVSNLVLDGRDVPVDAVKAEGSSRYTHDITLEKLRIVGHGKHQQIVGISTKCPSWNWVIRGNTIEGAGTGIYLGDSDGSAPFWAGLIENNLVVDSLGYNLQIKHQTARPYFQGAPIHPTRTIIRHNFFGKSRNASIGQMARPNVLVGHWPLTGLGSMDEYVIHTNLFWQNPGEALFQGEGNLTLCNNVFVNSSGPAVSIRPHNDVPRNIDIKFNTIVAQGDGVRIQNYSGASQWVQRIRRNIVFANQSPQDDRWLDNKVASYGEAGAYLRMPYAPIDEADFMPKGLASLPKRDCLAKDIITSKTGSPKWDSGANLPISSEIRQLR
jgi:hypothetical protein